MFCENVVLAECGGKHQLACHNPSFFRKPWLYGGVGLLIMLNVFSAVCAEDGYRNSQGK